MMVSNVSEEEVLHKKQKKKKKKKILEGLIGTKLEGLCYKG